MNHIVEHDDLSVGSSIISDDDASSKLDRSERSSRTGREEPDAPVLAQKENQQVTRSRLLMLLVLVAAAAATGGFTYWFIRNVELDDFDTRYRDFGRQVIEVTKINSVAIADTFKALSIQMTSSAIATGATWPNAIVPQFEAQAGNAAVTTGASLISLAVFVSPDQKLEYEEYSRNNIGWIQEGFNHSGHHGVEVPQTSPVIYQAGGRISDVPVSTHSLYAPLLQAAPAIYGAIFSNFDAFSYPFFPPVYDKMLETRRGILSQMTVSKSYGHGPFSFMATPIYADNTADSDLVGFISANLFWDLFFDNLLPEGVNGLILTVRTPCGKPHSFEINGPKVTFLGTEEYHDRRYEGKEVAGEFFAFGSICKVTLHVYPSEVFKKEYISNAPIYYTVAVIGIFILTGLVFVIYDFVVEKRQTTVVTSATRANAVVNSLFPAQVRDRLMEEAGGNNKKPSNPHAGREQNKSYENAPFTTRLDRVLGNGGNGENSVDNKDPQYTFGSKPIADLFPDATVMFADISGFTSWSSSREPTAVFQLLETVYNSFDRIAKRLKVFKVETIGDCYVAVAGLPTPRADHAVVMARFARDCMTKMNQIVPQLEITLGPDTGDLCMRFGLHSGPVTAGVLRGEKSRFQLFGDTVNTAARMETTGHKNRIHISQETAALLRAGGKGRWIQLRDGLVTAKGKGELQTYWCNFGTGSTVYSERTADSNSSGKSFNSMDRTNSMASVSIEPQIDLEGPSELAVSQRRNRLIEWNSDVLSQLIKKILAMRNPNKSKMALRMSISFKDHIITKRSGKTVLEEVKEIITLPSSASKYLQDPDTVQLKPEVSEQLLDYVTEVASLYRDNQFHSFEHASHVTMSSLKLLSRVVTPDMKPSETKNAAKIAATMHDYTFGITSDPLTQFAVVFSALVHDVDHEGVPNSQLVAENTELSKLYKNKSVAEQHSVDVAWELLMQPKYKALRDSIYSDQTELDRFRQLVVNSVMATDVIDEELGQLRKNRWNKAFNIDDQEMAPSSQFDDVNRKATIVIEHLIQASDVSHTMQHWHVYIKWNERLFCEMYKAYKSGRSDKDPSIDWFKGELAFYDFYVIPLAKKLKECGVFGVASDEYLNYAKANRAEWAKKGEKIVAEYLAACNK